MESKLVFVIFFLSLDFLIISQAHHAKLKHFDKLTVARSSNLTWTIDNALKPSGSLKIVGDTLHLEFNALGRKFKCIAYKKINFPSQGFKMFRNLDFVDKESPNVDFNYFQGHSLDRDKSFQCDGYVDVKRNTISISIETEDFDVLVEPSKDSEFYNHVAYKVNDVLNTQGGCIVQNRGSSRKTNRHRRETKPITEEELNFITDVSCPVDIIVTPSYLRLMDNDQNLIMGDLLLSFRLLNKWFSNWDYNFDDKPENFGIHLQDLQFVLDEKHPLSPSVILNETGSRAAMESFQKFKEFRGQNEELFNKKTCYTGVLYGFSYYDYLALTTGHHACEFPLNFWVGSRFMKYSDQSNRLSHMSTSEHAFQMAHEIGHLMGGLDYWYDQQACPGDDNIYVEHGYSRSPNETNTETKLSPCAIKERTYNVIRKGLMKYGCPIKKSALGSGICGNELLEENEECDCGTGKCDMFDACCSPGMTGVKEGLVILDPPCTLRRNSRGAQCSIQAGPCCNQMCKFRTSSEECQTPSDECGLRSNCSGYSAICPKGEASPDGTPCLKGTKLCKDGKCQHNVCSYWGMEDCQCSSLKESCLHCCMNSGSCVPAHTLAKNLRPGLLPLQDGEYCGNEGLCESGVCTEEDMISPRADELRIASKTKLETSTKLSIASLTADDNEPRIERGSCLRRPYILDPNDYFSEYVWIALLVLAILISILGVLYFCLQTKRKRLTFEEEVLDQLETLPQSPDLSPVVKSDPRLLMQASRLITMFPTALVNHVGELIETGQSEVELIKILLREGLPVKVQFKKIEGPGN